MATSTTTKKIGEYLINTDSDHILGETPTCTVFEGEHETGGEVAAKMARWLKGIPTDMVDEEAQLMKDLPPHDNVLKLLQYTKKEVDKNVQFWLILEKCQLGNLKQLALTNKLDLRQKVDLFLQSAKGLNHIHKHKLVHRDIKMENILVHGSLNTPVIKISDFGISRVVEREIAQMTTLGTNSYKAPELYQKDKPRAGKGVDTFSLGVTFVTILDPQEEEIITPTKVDKVPLGKYLDQHPLTDVAALIAKPSDSDEVRRIKRIVIAPMLSPSAESRPSMQQVVQQLSEIHTSLCMKILFAVNTAWTSPVFCTNKDSLSDVKTSISKEETEPKQYGAAATPHVSATNMECVEKASADNFIDLLSGSAYGEMKDGILVAVDTFVTKAVWIHTAIGWVKISGVPADYHMDYVCIREVPEGFVVLGGEDDEYKKTSQCWLFSFSNSKWTKLQDMSIARNSVSAVVVGEVLLAIGGVNNEGVELDVCEKMNLSTGEWSLAKSMPHNMSQPSVAAAAGHVYIKGWTSSVFISYDPNSDSYTDIPVPDFVPEDIYGACMVSYNDKLYLIGGVESLAVQHDPHTQKWEQLASPSARYGCCAVPLSGKILLCGGIMQEGSEYDTIKEYDVEHDVWKLLDIRLPFKFAYEHCHVFMQSK